MFFQYEHHQKLNFRPQLTLFSVSFQSYMLDGGKGGSSDSGSSGSSGYSGKLHVGGITARKGRGKKDGEGGIGSKKERNRDRNRERNRNR